MLITLKPKKGTQFTIPADDVKVSVGKQIEVLPNEKFSLIGWQRFDLAELSRITIILR